MKLQIVDIAQTKVHPVQNPILTTKCTRWKGNMLSLVEWDSKNCRKWLTGRNKRSRCRSDGELPIICLLNDRFHEALDYSSYRLRNWSIHNDNKVAWTLAKVEQRFLVQKKSQDFDFFDHVPVITVLQLLSGYLTPIEYFKEPPYDYHLCYEAPCSCHAYLSTIHCVPTRGHVERMVWLPATEKLMEMLLER